ncbi:MAG: mechanosensitive ion channel family protein [Eubacterium sp.]|nr:mechanosensitive ion channel family protein [Eubacterium sp.]
MKELFETIAAKTHIPTEILAVIATLVVGAIIIRIIRILVRRMLEKSSLDESAYVAILRTVRITCWILLGLSALIAAGVNPSPYIAVLASAGAALALALQDSLKNVAGGIIIIFTHPFVKGDEIQVEGVSGIVDFIDIMVTRIHSFDNKIITIPNSKMVNCILINKTREDKVRVDCKFSVSYDSDLAKVRVLLNNIVKEGDLLLDDPAPIIDVSAHEESGIVWDMLVWTKTENRFKAKYYLMEEVKKTFDENGVTIPYPHMNVIIEGESEQ